MKILTYRGQITLSKNDEICPLTISNQISTIINAHTKFGENQLTFTQVIVRKRKYGHTELRQADGRTFVHMDICWFKQYFI